MKPDNDGSGDDMIQELADQLREVENGDNSDQKEGVRPSDSAPAHPDRRLRVSVCTKAIELSNKLRTVVHGVAQSRGGI